MVSIIKYLLVEGNASALLLISYTLLQIFFLITANSIFIIQYLYKKHDKAFCDEMENFIFSISLYRKFIFFFFLVFVAIPNKILVNNDVSRLTQFILQLITFFIIIFFPPMLLVLFLRLIFTFECFVFCYTINNSQVVKKFFIKSVFCDNDVFFKSFIEFFYGGLNVRVNNFVVMSVPAILLVAVYSKARHLEVIRVEGLVSESLKRKLEIYYSDLSSTPLTLDEIFLLEKQTTREIIGSATIVLNIEDKIFHLFLNFFY